MSGVAVAKDTIKGLWKSVGLREAALSRLRLTGDADTAINSSFRLGVAAQSSIGLSGLSAAAVHALRTGEEQDVTVNARHAVLQCHSEAWYLIDNDLPKAELWDTIAGVYPTKEGGFVRIHTNFPHHRQGILSILKVPEPATREDVAKSLAQWDSVEFETEAASKDMCATAFRSYQQWSDHPQAKSLLGVPPVKLIKIGEAPKRTTPKSATLPLDGLRVLDLTRVLAGPVAGRAMAAQGADVLWITSPNLPSLPAIDVETSLGKRTTQIDLDQDEDKETLTNLAKEADVFLQAYRPGGLAARGFGPEELAKLRPGIICANLTAWGWDGPWKDRHGFDSLVQTATGFNHSEGEAFQQFEQREGPVAPKPLPMQCLDHAAGYLLSFGINAAICKTIEEGGSWEVQVSLAAVGQWIRSLGRLSPQEGFGLGKTFPARTVPQGPEVAELSVNWRGGVTALKQAAVLSKTPAKEGEDGVAPIVLNAHEPSWLPRS